MGLELLIIRTVPLSISVSTGDVLVLRSWLIRGYLRNLSHGNRLVKSMVGIASRSEYDIPVISDSVLTRCTLIVTVTSKDRTSGVKRYTCCYLAVSLSPGSQFPQNPFYQKPPNSSPL
jgi:hypothetical protein